MTGPIVTLTPEQEAELWRAHGFTRPPTEDELPETDMMPLDSEYQALQMQLLFDVLRRHFDGQDVYVGQNMIVYYSIAQVTNQDFLGPDVLVAKDVSPRMRKSWVMWQEGKGPDLVFEIVSPRSGRRDKGEKKRIYQDNIRATEYFWWDQEIEELAGFALHEGRYQPVGQSANGGLLSDVLGLQLVLWDGEYQSRQERWARWAMLDGALIPTREEAERQRADRFEAEIARLRARLGQNGEKPAE